MTIKNKTFFVILISFLISIAVSNIIIKKYDTYEISTDEIENHRIIKGDIPSIWINGETLKKDLQNGKSYFESGIENTRSYLPPRLIALYSYLFNYDLYDDWDKKIISIDNKKIYYLVLQSILYYTVLTFFFIKILKIYNKRACFFIICFLAIEPSIFFFHSSFHTESIYFSLQILMLTLLLDEVENKIKFIKIGLLLGVMFLQKTVTIFYIVPIGIFYIYKLKKKSVSPLIIIILCYVTLIFSIVGYGNLKRSGSFYIAPPDTKYTFYLYLPEQILTKAENITFLEASKKKKIDEKKWIDENNIDFEKESDRIRHYNYLQKYTFKILLKYPMTTLKYVIWKTFQTGILNPTYVYEFFENENAKKPPYYLEDNYKKINIPLRILYSLTLYSIIVLGFFRCNKEIKKEHCILLILSTAYMLLMLGWVGVARYFVPNLIFLSIFFGYGVQKIFQLKK